MEKLSVVSKETASPLLRAEKQPSESHLTEDGTLHEPPDVRL
jgi:hypothetical protein